jgi:osmoprotectant transport system ATP-binding protein
VPREPEADLPVVGEGATLNDALDTMLVSSAGAALVTGRGGRFVGVITVEVVMEAITRSRRAAKESEDKPVGTNTGTLDVLAASVATSDPESVDAGGTA